MEPSVLFDPDGVPMRAVWRIRGTPQEIRPAGWFLANARNWRIHPRAQRDALAGALDEIGWIDCVKINRRSDPAWGSDQGIATLFDGHCRVEEALRVGDDTAVPLEYYDLTPDEEAYALVTLDPLAGMAARDGEQLRSLLAEVETDSDGVQVLLDELAAWAGTALASLPPASEPASSGGARVLECPECGHRWSAEDV